MTVNKIFLFRKKSSASQDGSFDFVIRSIQKITGLISLVKLGEYHGSMESRRELTQDYVGWE